MRIQTEIRLRRGTLWILGSFLLHFVWKLLEDAILGWINTKIAEVSGMSDSSIQDAYPILITYGPVIFIMALAFVIVWGSYRLGWVGAYGEIATSHDSHAEVAKPQVNLTNKVRVWNALSYVNDESMWKFSEFWENFSRGGEYWLTRPPGTKSFLLDGNLLPNFEDAAKNGEIEVNGRRQHTSDYITLPASFWETNQIDRSAYNGRDSNWGGADGGKTQPKITGNRTGPVYVGLRVIEREIKRKWPPMNNLDLLVLANMGVQHG